MRMIPSAAAFLPIVLLASSAHAGAQAALPLPGCEGAPEVRKAIDEKLDSDKLDKMKLVDRWAYERQVLDDLIAKYPRELRPYESLGSRMLSRAPDEVPAERERWMKMAKDNPDDPLALLLAGEALANHDTPEAIRLLESAKNKAPEFPWPSLQLARIYFSGKRADKAKVAENLEAFFAVCPASTNGTAQFYLTKDQPLQPKVAAAMRASLDKETDPKRLEDYATLWGLEFRNRPPVEHDAVRAQVAADLKRLEAINPNGDAEWQAFLIGGYKESGASKEAVTAKEDRLLHDFPHSQEADEIVSRRWEKDHKEPADQSDAAAWAKYEKEHEQALKEWMREFPDDTYLERYAWFEAAYQDDSIPEKEALAAIDTYVQSVRDYEPKSMWFWRYQSVAGMLLERHWRPEQALDLLSQARAAVEQTRAREDQDDNRSDEQLKDRNEERIYEDQYLDELVLQAAMQMNRPGEAMKLQARIEAPPPADKKFQSEYWFIRARFEAVQHHTQDALAYYQLALQTRTETPKARRGKLVDDLGNEARALWKAQGGTDAAWAVWSKPPAGDTKQLADGDWQKPTKEIPQFELSDLTGKTWRLKDLGGKTLLINLWATWCGPCQEELPLLEKFYEKNKDRADIQVLTFDIDEDPGLVAPFMKEKGYTFPVLPAYSTVVSLLDGFAIPQTWLVDSKGKWQWKQVGYGGVGDADFEKDLLARIDSTKMSE